MGKKADVKKVLFLYALEDEKLWKDGLWAAINILKDTFDIQMVNIETDKYTLRKKTTDADFILSWGSFGSPTDQLARELLPSNGQEIKRGLCIGGYSVPFGVQAYDVIFYETEWTKWWFEQAFKHDNLVHAFGVNTDIYKPIENAPRIWDYITVGAFSKWKRQVYMLTKKGPRFAIGQVQKNNLQESIDILGQLVMNGVGVSDMVAPETLAKMYNSASICYLPAEELGGGERALLEARACGIDVEIEPDNEKLEELLTSPIWDHKYYAEQLRKGIESCL